MGGAWPELAQSRCPLGVGAPGPRVRSGTLLKPLAFLGSEAGWGGTLCRAMGHIRSARPRGA